jgi:riboflavin kinase/FMN adenylyltransferase
MLTLFGPAHRRQPFPSPACVTIGVFDGVHLGHQEVIRRGVAEARSAHLPAIVLTFDRHPLEILRPEKAPPLLSSLCQRLRLFESLEVDATVVLPFDSSLAHMTHDEFYQQVLRDALRAERAVVGHDFGFGKGRSGDARWLASQLPTVIVEPILIDGERVSSSAIRSRIAVGDVEGAARWLGRWYAVEGIVVAGNQLGTTLEMPTANLALADRYAIPAEGVYAGWARCGDYLYEAAISVGDRPSIPGAGFAVEAHLLDYEGGALYGRAMQLEFVRLVRPQERFENLSLLAQKMKEDVERVHAVLEELGA